MIITFMEEEIMNDRKLRKSSVDRKIDGVCGGFAEYFGIDSTWVRLFWVIFTLAGGSGIIAYIVCMLIMPNN